MADPPSPLSVSGPLSTGERFKPSGWADEGDLDPYAAAEAANRTAAEKQKAIAEGFEKRRPKEEAETERAYAGVERAMAQPRPAIPRMERVESPPKPEDYHKMSMEYLGAMVLLGAFGGKFIRNAANAPLAAFNGALKGWQEGNLEAYQQKSAEWKEKQQQVLDNNRARLDEYKTILEDRNASIEDQMLRAKLVAAKHQDKIMYDRLDAGNWNGFAQAYDHGVAAHERTVAATDKFIEQQTQVNETAVERANEWKAYLATPQGQQELAQLDQRSSGAAFRIRSFVRQYADPAAPAPDTAGGVPAVEPPPVTPITAASTARMPPELRAPFPPHGAKAAERDAWYFEKDIWEKHGRPPSDEERGEHYRLQHQPRSVAGMDIEEFRKKWRAEHGGQDPPPEERIKFEGRRNAEISGAGALGRRMAAVEFSAQEFDNMMPIMQRTSDAVARKKFVPYNRLKNMALEGTSNVPFKEFKNAVAGGITAYAGTMSRSGATTVYAQHRADEVLGVADSKEAFDAGMKILKQEVDAVRAAGPQTLSTLERIFGASGIDPKVRPELEQAAGRGGKPAQVEQGGYIYRLGADGEYHPADEEE